MRGRAFLGVAIALCIAVACGSASPAQSVAADPTALRVLAPSAVPGVPSTTSVLTAGELARESGLPALASDMTTWGYIDGRERVFQGESRHLTLVISRSLEFRETAGALAFVHFVEANGGAFFGGVVGTQPLAAQGRSGWMFTPQGCACHMANPAVAGVLAAGVGVVWLEINGPDATPALLTSLLDPANSTPTT